MNKRSTLAALAAAALLGGCAAIDEMRGWTTVIDGGRGLENFNRIGEANWRAEADAIVADRGNAGFLVTRKVYRDFQLRAEFWADHTTNSGIFIRAADPQKIEATNSYEVNIFDQRPDPTYGTGAIVGFAKVAPMPKAGGKWNVYEVTAKGPEVTVILNGVQTVHMRDTKFAQGPFALQYAPGANNIPGGAIKWRKLQVREL